MWISEHSIGSTVLISVSKDNSEVEFETRIIETINDVGKRLVLCDLITSDDRVLAFNGLLCKVTIIGEDGREYIYRTKSVMNITIHSRRLLAIQCLTAVQPKNNRKAYRYPLTCNVVIRPKQHRGTCDGFMKDISQTGICFVITDLSYLLHIGELVSLAFEFEKINYRLECIVTRVEEREEGGYIVGGELIKYTSHVQHLISRLGMLEARLRREQKDAGQG